MQPTIDRDPRVRFKHPVRVVPIGGPPRAYRVLASNLSREGMSLRMPTPFDTGTRVALSLEAGGRVLPFAQAEVVWRELGEPKAPGRGAGFGVRFTGFLHPRAHELVDYLVANLETGKPLSAPQPAGPGRRWLRWAAAGLIAVVLGAGITGGALRLAGAQSSGAVVAGAAGIAGELTVKAEGPAPIGEPAAAAPGAIAPASLDPAAEGRTEAASLDPAAEGRTEAASLDPAAEGRTEAASLERAAEGRTEAASLERAAEVDPGPTAQTLTIPSGAVRSISAAVEGDQLRLKLSLVSGAAIARAFTLRSPDRLAIDVRGPAPKKSHAVSGSAAIQKLRVGRLPRGTRIVLDLARPPGKPVVVSGTSVSVPLR